MSAVVLLEWKFSPPNYFEEAIQISRQDYTMTIADGQIQAKIDSAIYEANPSMRQGLHDALNDRFLGVQLFTHRAYELSKPTMTRVHPDGHKDYFVQLEPDRLVLSDGTVDTRLTDKNGNVISDSKQDRIEKKRSLAELVTTYRATDSVLAFLLRSYDVAVRDPSNELVHLYEIRDALKVRFGGDAAAKAALGISSPQWSRMGQLCNDEPLRQGRHRGKTVGVVRDASEGELAEARGIARAMIERYLHHLEASSGR
jgi:hypothetical protein